MAKGERDWMRTELTATIRKKPLISPKENQTGSQPYYYMAKITTKQQFLKDEKEWLEYQAEIIRITFFEALQF